MANRWPAPPTRLVPRWASACAALTFVATALSQSACSHRGAGAGHEWTQPTLRDTRDDPAVVRPGFGNGAQTWSTWWPLTAPEAAALNGLAAAAQGDARALLALAILSSGDVRDAAGYPPIQQRVEAFLTAVKPTLDRAADDWHRGYELHRAMHRTFFTGGGDLNGYDVEQPRLTRIFATGRYNCLSSAVLFVVLARAFDLPVRAVVVPTHVFVELGAPGVRPIEIETTSSTGFDLVHDRKFYAEEASGWSARRGLRPVTIEEYEHREILSPLRLMALAMRNVHPGAGEDDQLRMAELAALLDPDSLEIQRNRLQAYGIEANHLMDKKAWRTMARFLDLVKPAVTAAGTVMAGGSRDAEIQQSVSWLNWYHGQALMIVGRQDEAVAIMHAGIEHIDPSWPDAASLRNNYIVLFNDRLAAFLDAKAFTQAEQLVLAHLEACRADAVCGGNAGVLYLNWSVDIQNTGDWPAARQVLQNCVARLPAEQRCRDMLADLETRHAF